MSNLKTAVPIAIIITALGFLVAWIATVAGRSTYQEKVHILSIVFEPEREETYQVQVEDTATIQVVVNERGTSITRDVKITTGSHEENRIRLVPPMWFMVFKCMHGTVAARAKVATYPDFLKKVKRNTDYWISYKARNNQTDHKGLLDPSPVRLIYEGGKLEE